MKKPEISEIWLSNRRKTHSAEEKICIVLAGLRGKWQSQYIFETVDWAQNQAKQWLWTYNNERSNNLHWWHHTRNETKNSCVNSIAGPH